MVRLHMDFVVAQTTRREIRRALKALPEKLSGTYDTALDRIRYQEQPLRNFADRILMWIYFAYRPLRVNELQHALVVKVGQPQFDEDGVIEENDLTTCCAGLAIVEDNTVRLVHSTTKEYLKGSCTRLFPQAQTEITKIFLTFLLLEDLPKYEQDSSQI